MALLKRLLRSLSKIFKVRKRPRKTRKLSRRVGPSKQRVRRPAKRTATKRRSISAKSAPRRRKLKAPTKTRKSKPPRIKRPAVKSKRAVSPQVKKIETPPGVLIGGVTHFFSKISVVVISMSGPLSVGEEIEIRGKQGGFKQRVDSLQIESVDVKSAKKGQLVGLKVVREARPGDKVYRLP